MKAMKYKNTDWGKRKPELLHGEIIVSDDVPGNIEIRVVSMGSHPCVYLGLSPELPIVKHIYNKKESDEGWQTGYDKVDLPVHGGLGFGNVGDDRALSKDKFWLGWDYAHMGDYMCYPLEAKTLKELNKGLDGQPGKKWTTKELVEEAREAIPYLLKEIKQYESKKKMS